MKISAKNILYLIISLAEILFFITTILSISILSFYVYGFTQIPFNDLYDSRYAGIPMSSCFISLLSIVYLLVHFALKLHEKYLIVFAIFSLIPNILNLSYLPLISSSNEEEAYKLFMENFHKYDSMQKWSNTIGFCCNITTDPTWGLIPGGKPACDLLIRSSVQNRFVVPYKYMKNISILRVVGYFIVVIFFVIEYIFREKLNESDE